MGCTARLLRLSPGIFCASEILMAALRLLLLARRRGRQYNPYIARLDRSLLVL